MFKSKIFKMFSVALLVFLCTFIVPKNANAEILCSNFSENSLNTALASKSPTIKGSDVLLIGESFIALSHDITKYLEENAHNAGVLANNVSPKCYWLDLRPVFSGKYSQYIKPDGIHPTAAGSKATADAIWKVIQDNNVFNK